jgi:hypothetical protein
MRGSMGMPSTLRLFRAKRTRTGPRIPAEVCLDEGESQECKGTTGGGQSLSTPQGGVYETLDQRDQQR